MENFIYYDQTVHHKPCFNLFILHNNLFANQGSEINKNDIFCTFRHTVSYEKFFPTSYSTLFSLALSVCLSVCLPVSLYIHISITSPPMSYRLLTT